MVGQKRCTNECCLEVFISDGRLHCILKDADTSFVLHTIVCTQFCKQVILWGDFSYPSICSSDLALILSKSNTESDFIDMCLTFRVSQLVSTQTRVAKHSSNILDLLLASNPDRLLCLLYLMVLSDRVVMHTFFNLLLLKTKKKKEFSRCYTLVTQEGKCLLHIW